MDKKVIFSRDEMYELNVERLKERGVELEEIAKIAYIFYILFHQL